MKNILLAILSFSSFVVINASAEPVNKSGDKKTEEKLSLTITLVDRSKLIGVPSASQIQIKTSYARMDVPFKGIYNIEFEKSTKTVKIRFANDDLLNGTIETDSLELVTLLGNISIALKHIDSIEVSAKTGEHLPASLLKGLVLHYTFDKNKMGRVTDKKGNQTDVKVHGATWTRNGKTGGAYKFESKKNDYLQISLIDSPLRIDTANSGLTISTWVKFTSDSAAYFLSLPVAAGTRSSPGIFFSQGTVYFYCGNRVSPAKSGNIASRKWYHVVGACNTDKTLDIYVNGKKATSGSYANHVNSSILSLLFGKDLLSRHVDAVIDEIMIFNSTLSNKDIESLYKHGL